MAIAALVLWMSTAAVGSYLLVTSLRSGNAAPAPQARPAPAPAEPVSVPVATPAPARLGRDRFDPQSLRDAKAEPMPGLRDLAEFAHPALAIIGLGFWFGYVLSHNRTFFAIGFGILVGAIAAGVSLFTVNARAARRAAAGQAAAADEEPPSFTPRLLILHGVGAALTLLFAALIAAHV